MVALLTAIIFFFLCSFHFPLLHEEGKKEWSRQASISFECLFEPVLASLFLLTHIDLGGRRLLTHRKPFTKKSGRPNLQNGQYIKKPSLRWVQLFNRYYL